MASAKYPNDTKFSPSCEFHHETNSGVPYQQVPPPSFSSNFVSPTQPSPVIVYTQPTVFNSVIGTPFLGHYPTVVQCPRCHQQVVTLVQYTNGGGTWLISLIICLLGGIFGCCLIPFCVSACQDAVHICPSCQNVIGAHKLI